MAGHDRLDMLGGVAKPYVRGLMGLRSRVVRVEPGIGKSTLMRAGLANAPRLGCQIAWGTADELSQRFPLHVMLDCLEVDARSPDRRRAEVALLLRGGS
jgi:hypothetical protein